MFMEEQAAMYLIATWDLPNFTTNDDVPQEFRDKVGYFKFPTVDDSGDMNNYVGGPGVGLFVSEQSDTKEEAKEFASYLVEQWGRSEEHTSELQSRGHLVCRLLLEKKKEINNTSISER